MDGTGLDAAAIAAFDATTSGVVVGGPGTGKTTALVARAARLVREAGSDRVLVLTPTRRTATALRDRIALAAGVATGGPVARSTAAFAFEVVRAAASSSGAPPPRLLTGGDQDRLLADLLAGDAADEAGGRGRWPASIAPELRASRTFRTELRAFLAECVECGLAPAELAAVGVAAERPAWRAAATFLGDYLDARDAMGGADREPAELVAEAAALLAGPAPAAEPRFVLVDDAQELTRGGIALLRALRDRGDAVLAFGDPDIASGAFRGAAPALFAELCGVLGAVSVLDAPHRQAPALTRLTRTVTAAIGAAGRVDHRRAPAPADPDEDPAVVRVVRAPSPHEEIDAVARALREWRVRDDVPWGRMAVIAHDARQVVDLAAELAAREVPTQAGGALRPLGQEPVVRDLLRLLTVALADPADRDADEVAAVLVSPFGGLDAVGLRRLRARLRQAELAGGGTRPAGELVAAALARPLGLVLVDGPEARVAERLGETVAGLRRLAAERASVHELLWHAWDRSRDRAGRRLADSWRELAASGGILAAEADRSLDGLVALFEAAKRDGERGEGHAPLAFAERLLGADVANDTLASPERPGAVAVLTPAGALGTEFDAVVVAGVQDGVWPNVRPRGGLLDTWRLADAVAAHRAGRPEPEPSRLDRRRDALHDELRLFVRAVSRARRRLLVTAVDDDDLGPSPLFGFLPEAEPPVAAEAEHPLTLRGLVARHRRVLTTSTRERERTAAAEQLRALARAGVPGADPGDWYGIAPATSDGPLRDPERGPVRVSPSRLDGFETCPLDWAIRVLGGDTRSRSAGVGTILHAAMAEAGTGDAAELRALVDARWGDLDFETPWLSDKERAWADVLVDRLAVYLRRFHEHGGTAIGAEAEFRVAIGLGDDGPTVARATDETSDEVPSPRDEVVRPSGGQEATGGPVALLAGSVDRIELYPSDRGESLPAGEPGGVRALVVDLKTGRGETRLTDEKVVDDAQLAAYQLALRHGGIPGTADADIAGARLLVLSKTLRDAQYRLARQAPLDDDAEARLLARVVATARAMASDRFDAHLDAHCRVDRFGVCAIHTVKAVSAS